MRKKEKFKSSMKKQNGITITTMIIAIILIIILAAVSITTLRNSDRDVLETATEAKVSMEVASYKEVLDVIETICTSEQINEGLSTSEYLDLVRESIEADSTFENSTVEKISSTCLRVQTEEGYVFYIYNDGIEYQGTNGEFTEVYAITEDDVIFTYNPSSWTNGTVEVSIVLDFDTGDNLFQYSFDKSEWEDYLDSFVVSENTVIYVKYTADNYEETYVKGEVSNIDTVAPLDFTPKVKSTSTDTITVTGETEDGAATDTSGQSGIDHYEFSIDGGITWYDIEDSATYDKSSSDIEFTFSGLTQETTYTLGMKAVDSAGNETEGYTTGSTTSIPDADDCLVFNFSDNYSDDADIVWTNEDVTLDIEAADDDVAELIEDGIYIIQYKLESDGVWRTYTGTITFDENDTIYARISDGTNTGEEKEATVACIDKDSPETPELTAEDVTETTITISVETEDDLGGISYYYYVIENYIINDDGEEVITTVGEYSSSSSSITFTGLEDQSSYLITVTVFDEAGNYSTSETMKISTGEVSELYYTFDTSYEVGDYVNYSIDINENGDTTDDWRIFYIDDDGNIFIIATSYLPTTSKYIDLDELLVARTDAEDYDEDEVEEDYISYGFSWWNIVSDSDKESASATVQSNLDSTVLDLFMSDWPYLETAKQVTARACAIQMYQSFWDGLVDSTYATYAIGSVTFEMWEAAWEAQGYDKIYYDATLSTTGYMLSLDGNSYANDVIVTFAALENSGYYDDLFFPSNFSNYNFSSASSSSASRFIHLSSTGQITWQSNNRNSDSAGNYSYSYSYLRPVVMLKSSTYLEMNSNGIVELYTSNPETKEANLELYYLTDNGDTTWTNGYATVYVNLNSDELKEKIENGIYEIQYAESSPDDESSWVTCETNLNLKVTENKTIYVRIFDGTRSGDYASIIINIIDKLEPEDFEIETEAALNTIVIAGSTTDQAATDESGSSGIDYYIYEVTNESGETRSYETTYPVSNYVISDDEFLLYDTTYTLIAKAVDKAENIKTSSTTYTVELVGQATSGDWVEYSIDLNGDGDYTNDWRMFYEDDDGNKFIIAADYIKYNVTDSSGNYLMNYDTATSSSGTGLSYLIGKNYIYYWLSAPTKQTVNSTTNSLFMAEWDYSGTSYSNTKCVLTLLNTSNWSNFVDTDYATYAIGSPTLEMWVEAWNEKGYTTIYTDTGTYGYYIGTTSSLDSSSFSVDLSESDGYNDSLFYPHKSAYGSDGTSCNGYWLASPSASYNLYLMRVYFVGAVYNGNYNNTNYSVRPLVCLKSDTKTTYNSSTGVWTLSTS